MNDNLAPTNEPPVPKWHNKSPYSTEGTGLHVAGLGFFWFLCLGIMSSPMYLEKLYPEGPDSLFFPKGDVLYKPKSQSEELRD